MLKRIVALMTAGIFFLTAPTLALAKESDLVDKPFQQVEDDKPQPTTLSPDEQTAQPTTLSPDEQTAQPTTLPPDEQTAQPTTPEEPPQTSTPPQEEVEGLEFLLYEQDGVMAFAVIADHEKYQLRPVLARGKVPGLATVSQMNASNAIATINASYFGGNGTIYGNTRIDGLTAGTTYFIRSAMGIMANGSIIFARQIYRGSLYFNDIEIVINGVNCERNPNTVVVYNSWNGATTGTNNSGIELVVKDNHVTEIFRGKGNNAIPTDGIIVSATGTVAENFANLQVGDRLKFEEDYINMEHTGDFNNAIHIIGAGPTLVKGGEIHVTADAEQFPDDIRVGRAPRSAVGITKYGDYIFAVVDGRQAHSKGCTLTEWARILKDNFGAVEALNLDGGGSTELVFKGSLVNSPSDGSERYVGDALTILRR